MKAIHIALVLLPAVAGSAAYLLLRPVPHPEPVPAVAAVAVHQEEAPKAPPVETNTVCKAPAKPPVQPIEERGDAMLFEIDALQNTPFDQSVTMPFD